MRGDKFHKGVPTDRHMKTRSTGHAFRDPELGRMAAVAALLGAVMLDDQSGDSVSPRGIDLVAARAGSFVRGISPPQSAVITATGVTTGVDVSGHGAIRLDLVISAATGTTPSDTITIQTSSDNGVLDNWRTVGAFAAQTAAGTVHLTLAGLDRFVRASHVISGTTPSFTYTLSGEVV